MWTKKLVGTALDIETCDDTPIVSFQFDSRDIKAGDCFIALPGEIRDGHDFIEVARARGAACVIGQKGAEFTVADSYKALQQLAIYARDTSKAKRIAITGSVGKTSTTTFMGQLLSQHHSTVVPEGSFNNHIGVPLTMTKLLGQDIGYGVFEIGTNHPGEIRPLAELVKPHIAIITKIGTAHIGHFENKHAIAEEKAQILYALAEDGVGIVPEDEFLEVYQASGKKLVVVPDCHLVWNDKMPHIPMRLHTNIALVIKAAELLGVKDYDLSQLQVPKGRGRISTATIAGHNVTIIDDAYNAAFDAMMASLEDLLKLPGRKIVVIGDMGEVGTMSDTYHAAVAEKIKGSPIAHIIPVSPNISHALGLLQIDPDQVISLLQHTVQDGDIIFFKGSHGSGVWKIVKTLS